MGNRFSTDLEEYSDPEGPGDLCQFFQDLEVKWVDIFIGRVREIFSFSTVDVFDLSTDKAIKQCPMLKWRDFFKIFVFVKEKYEIDEVYSGI